MPISRHSTNRRICTRPPTQVLTLQQGFPAQTANNKILNTAGVNPFYQPGLHADLDARHRNFFHAELAARSDLHRNERHRSRSLARAQSRPARHQPARHADRRCRFPTPPAFTTTSPARIRFTTRCKCAWYTASRAAFPFRGSTPIRNRSTTPAPSAAPAASSCNRTATTPPSAASLPSTCATSSASPPLTNFPSESATAGRITDGRKKPSAICV